MGDTDIRDLCHRFFDAYQAARVAELRGNILSDDCLIWTNVHGERTRDEILAILPAAQDHHRRLVYNDRSIDTFAEGFVIRLTLNISERSGRNSALMVAIVGLCCDGKITRIDEYLDPPKSPAWPSSGNSTP